MRHNYIAAVLSIAGALALASHAMAADSSELEVKKFYEKWEKLENSDAFAKDPSIGLAYVDAKNGRIFDVMEPEEFAGAAFAKHFVDVNTKYPTKMKFVNMKVRAQGNVAWASYIQVSYVKMPNGGATEVRVRTVDGLEKIDGKWRIVDESLSLPLDEATMGAVMMKKK
jgi:ketosteroid isomerase-like protein